METDLSYWRSFAPPPKHASSCAPKGRSRFRPSIRRSTSSQLSRVYDSRVSAVVTPHADLAFEHMGAVLMANGNLSVVAAAEAQIDVRFGRRLDATPAGEQIAPALLVVRQMTLVPV